MKLNQKVTIIIIFVLGFWVRLYKINNPIADWHSHRQADTASVTNLYLQNGLDLLHPKYHDLSDVQSGKENPQGYRMVEFPVYNLICFTNYKIVSIFSKNISYEVVYRFTSIIISLTSALFIFLLVKKLTDNFFASAICLSSFLFIPFNIYYSRAILPEPLAILFSITTLYFFAKNKIISAIFFALGILIKPYIAIILFPFLLFLSLQKISLKKLIPLFIFSIISLIPFIAWRIWIHQFSEGIPSALWLLNNSNSKIVNDWWHGLHIDWINKIIAFRPHWINWLFAERIGKLILGIYGSIFVFLGLNYKKNTTQNFTTLTFIGILFYFIIIAQGNIQHDYYQNLIMPFISIYFGLGIYYIYDIMFHQKITAWFVILPILGLSLFFSWNQIKGYYQINNGNIIQVGEIVNKTLPLNAIVIAPYQGDTAFLYQTRRTGYPTEIYNFSEISKLTPNNPHFLVSLNNDTYTNKMAHQYQTVVKNNEYIILNLDNEIKK